MASQLTPQQITEICAAEKFDSLAATKASKLSEERSKALDYYKGDMSEDMPSEPDRSQAVSTDVSDTVEGLMPSLMEIFTGGDEVVRFAPNGRDDEDAADQETDYVNYVFQQQNPGFLILYSFVKDALLQKVGIVKVWWQEDEREDRQTFYDLTDDAYGIVVSTPDVEIAEHSEHPGPQVVLPTGEPLPPATLHDVTLVKSKTIGRVKIEPVPPEEFGISRRAKNIKDCGYCFHEVRRTEAELIGQGYDPDQVKSLPTADFPVTEEAAARDTVDDQIQGSQSGINKATRLLKVTEHYVLLDMRGDGKSQIHRVTTGGEPGQILKRGGKEDIVEVDAYPFAAMTPFINTHRFFGRSVADIVMDIQRIKTSLLRSLLDNAYLANNQRTEVSESHAGDNTIDDLLNNRPGGIVRTRAPGGLNVLQSQPIGDFVFPLISYMDATREWRTGVTKQGQGLDPNALQNIGENAILDAATAARARTKLIARIFAETGIRDMFGLIHNTIRENGTEPETVWLKNKWSTVDPRQWKPRSEMTITVGLGTATNQAQLGFLAQILGIQKEALMSAPQLGLVSPENIYHTLKRMVQLAGLRSIEPFFNDPNATDANGQPLPKPPAPPNPKAMELQAQQQMAQQRLQMDAQIAQQKVQADHAADLARIQSDQQLEMSKIQFTAQVEQYRAYLDAQKPQQQAKPPSITVNFKDLPPEAQVQALAQDGISIDPQTLAFYKALGQQPRQGAAQT